MIETSGATVGAGTCLCAWKCPVASLFLQGSPATAKDQSQTLASVLAAIRIGLGDHESPQAIRTTEWLAGLPAANRDARPDPGESAAREAKR